MDPEQSTFLLPCLLDFVLHPRSIRGFAADQNDHAALVLHVVVYPPLDRCIALAPGRLPVVGRDGLIAVDHAHISNLLDPKYVVVEVEAEEDWFPCHSPPYLIRTITVNIVAMSAP